MVIAIINQKGGTGKTTTAHNLGIGLSMEGKSVLMIDLDPQANLTYSLGINEPDGSLTDVLYQDKSINEVIVQVGQLDLIPSDIDLANTELFLSQQQNREFVLSDKLKTIEKNYDFIIIDCQTSLSVLTINALVATQKVIVPLQLTIFSIKGLDLIVTTVNNIHNSLNDELELLGVLPVMVDKRRKLSNEVLTLIDESFDVKIFNNHISNSVRVAEAPSFGVSAIEYDGHSKASQNYIDFTKEVLQSLK